MSQRVFAVVCLVGCIAVSALADEFRFEPAFTQEDFKDLTGVLGDCLSFPNSGTGSSFGLTGFEVLVGVGGPKIDTGERWWRYGVDGRTIGGVVPSGRGIVRKGLPYKLDVGAQYGWVLGQKFWGLEARYCLLKGGALEPAVGLRASYSRFEDSPVKVEVKEIQLVVSKGFVVVSPYAAIGMRWSDGEAFFGDPLPRQHRVTHNVTTGAAGVRITLLPFRILAEVRQGAKTGFFVGVGVGL